MKIITKLFGRIYVINIFTVLIKLKHYFFNPVQPPLLLIIITMSNPPIIPTPPIIRASRVILHKIFVTYLRNQMKLDFLWKLLQLICFSFLALLPDFHFCKGDWPMSVTSFEIFQEFPYFRKF